MNKIVRYAGGSRGVLAESIVEYSDGSTRVRCADGRVFDVGVRDTVWSEDIGEWVDVFYSNEAQEIFPDWDWRK